MESPVRWLPSAGLSSASTPSFASFMPQAFSTDFLARRLRRRFVADPWGFYGEMTYSARAGRDRKAWFFRRSPDAAEPQGRYSKIIATLGKVIDDSLRTQLAPSVFEGIARGPGRRRTVADE
jgi:hypothetical protein